MRRGQISFIVVQSWFCFGIWYRSHQKPQIEEPQCADLLLFLARKVEGDTEEILTCGECY